MSTGPWLAVPLGVATIGCGDDGGTGDRGGIDAGVAACSPDPSVTADDLTLVPVVSGLSQPLFVTAPPGDSRLFVVEQPGRIRIVDGGSLVTAPYLDISD